MKKLLYICCFLLCSSPLMAVATYDVSSDRRTTWNAGLDPVGGIPNYTNVTCTGLDPTGATDNAAKINACISAASAQTAVYIPAGVYLVNSSINMKSNVVLRGAKSSQVPFLPTADATATTLNMGGNAISFNGGSKTSNWYPGINSGTTITAGYTTGSTNLTLSSITGYSVGNYVSIYQDDDSSFINLYQCSYCGEDNGYGHAMQQYAKITAINGTTITIDRPVYTVTPNFSSAWVRRQTFGISMAGVENIRLVGNGSNSELIYMNFARNCWAKGVETYNSGTYQILLAFSHQCEIRDSYCHTSNGPNAHLSGYAYGITVMWWNSDHKIENNIVRDTRHSIIFAGGGAGCAVLYNYSTDNYESETTTNLSQDITTHAAHPHMNLFEGNSAQKLSDDSTHGSSSHNTWFRNYSTGTRSTPAFSWSQWGVDIFAWNWYYNIVGNVVGQSSWTTGTVLANGNCSPTEPDVYRFGCNGTPGSYIDSVSYSTAIKHGNYDYITKGVAYWDGGTDHALKNSLYYSSKPAFFGSLAWPPYGPDLNPMVGSLPAKQRFLGNAVISAGIPMPPLNLTIQ